jgi:hypothetical protein
MLEESVTDKFFRVRLAKTGGFCHQHSWQIAARNSPLGSAILFRDMFGRQAARLDGNGKMRSQRGLQPCLLCDVENGTVKRYLGVMADNIEQPDFRASCEQADGLCIPHLELLLPFLAKKDRRWIAGLQQRRYADILEGLDAFIDRLHFGKGGGAFNDEEKQRWRKALALTVRDQGTVV